MVTADRWRDLNDPHETIALGAEISDDTGEPSEVLLAWEDTSILTSSTYLWVILWIIMLEHFTTPSV